MGPVLSFAVESVLMGFALSMDAFSISLVSGFFEPAMKKRKAAAIAGTFAGFQILMPLIGWFFVHTLVSLFEAVEKWIPPAAFLALLLIGGKMLIQSLRGGKEEQPPMNLPSLLLLGVATSIDALSVGFTIAEAGVFQALAESLIIGIVTFAVCLCGVWIGKKAGPSLAGKAGIVGGVLLICIGVKILLGGLFGF